MKNLLIITQKVNENDDLLGFFVNWIREFSKNFDKVYVVSLEVGNFDLPQNIEVYSMGKENNNSKFFRFLKFYYLLFKFVPRVDGIFAHMSPMFAIASWPVSFFFRKKIILWYLHRAITFRLRLAKLFSYKIVTASKDSLNIKSSKIVELGHGVDSSMFWTERNWARQDLASIVSVGRISRIKNYETLIRSAKILKDRGVSFRINIVGRPVMPDDFAYFDDLKKMASDNGLESNINFVGFVPFTKVAEYYKNSNININMAPTGGLDKAVLEGMSAGCITLVCNRAFAPLIMDERLMFEYNNSLNLAEKIKAVIDMTTEEKSKLSSSLEDKVKKYDISAVVKKIAFLFA